MAYELPFERYKKWLRGEGEEPTTSILLEQGIRPIIQGPPISGGQSRPASLGIDPSAQSTPPERSQGGQQAETSSIGTQESSIVPISIKPGTTGSAGERLLAPISGKGETSEALLSSLRDAFFYPGNEQFLEKYPGYFKNPGETYPGLLGAWKEQKQPGSWKEIESIIGATMPRIPIEDPNASAVTKDLLGRIQTYIGNLSNPKSLQTYLMPAFPGMTPGEARFEAGNIMGDPAFRSAQEEASKVASSAPDWLEAALGVASSKPPGVSEVVKKPIGPPVLVPPTLPGGTPRLPPDKTVVEKAGLPQQPEEVDKVFGTISQAIAKAMLQAQGGNPLAAAMDAMGIQKYLDQEQSKADGWRGEQSDNLLYWKKKLNEARKLYKKSERGSDWGSIARIGLGAEKRYR